MEHKRSLLGILLALIGAGLSILFLANLTFGVAELIPDNLPFVGNLDEVLASAIFFSSLSYLGINVIPTKWSHPAGRNLPAGGQIIDRRGERVG